MFRPGRISLTITTKIRVQQVTIKKKKPVDFMSNPKDPYPSLE